MEWQEFKKGICEFLGIPLAPADDIQFKCLEAVTGFYSYFIFHLFESFNKVLFCYSQQQNRKV